MLFSQARLYIRYGFETDPKKKWINLEFFITNDL